jgi:hypothetical protein
MKKGLNYTSIAPSPFVSVLSFFFNDFTFDNLYGIMSPALYYLKIISFYILYTPPSLSLYYRILKLSFIDLFPPIPLTLKKSF